MLTSMEMLIRITDDYRIFLETAGLTKTKKEVSLEQLASVFIDNTVPDEKRSVELPYGTVSYTAREKKGMIIEETIIIVRVPEIRPLRYYETKFKEIPFPILIFKVDVRANKIGDVRVGALKSTILKDDTVVYRYPYSNVYHDGRICFGNNSLPKVNSLKELSVIPEMFLSGEHNNDLYNDANSSGLDYRALLEVLDGTPFDYSILLPWCTYKEFKGNN